MGERGQVTIPKELRERLGLRAGQVVEFEEVEGTIVVRKQLPRDPLDALYGILETGQSTDDLVAGLRESGGTGHGDAG